MQNMSSVNAKSGISCLTNIKIRISGIQGARSAFTIVWVLLKPLAGSYSSSLSLRGGGSDKGFTLVSVLPDTPNTIRLADSDAVLCNAADFSSAAFSAIKVFKKKKSGTQIKCVLSSVWLCVICNGRMCKIYLKLMRKRPWQFSQKCVNLF